MKFTWLKPAKRDDPIYREGLTISTPRSHRSSTPSTKPSPKTPDTDSSPGSKAKARFPKAAAPRQESQMKDASPKAALKSKTSDSSTSSSEGPRALRLTNPPVSLIPRDEASLPDSWRVRAKRAKKMSR